jgi:hypothetical protein
MFHNDQSKKEDAKAQPRHNQGRKVIVYNPNIFAANLIRLMTEAVQDLNTNSYDYKVQLTQKASK